MGNGGFSIAYGPGEEECAFSIGDGWVFEVFSGINKVGFTFTKEADFGAHTGGAYVHAYVRTPTIAAAVLCAIFLPEAFPVVVGAAIAS